MILRREMWICCLLAAGLASAPSYADEALRPLSDTRWNSAETDDIAFLTASPGECLAPAIDPDVQYRVEVGRAAFSSPFVFGGAAARSGLSCNSCHRDGRDNPDFYLEGLSDAPGTADVTSSLFSKTREDHEFNPTVIPTLLDIAGKDAFGAAAPQPTIHAFVESAVTDEFQGVAAPGVVEGIAAYVAQLDSVSCPARETQQTVKRAMNDIARILKTAEAAFARDDNAVADLLLVSAQHQLGRVYERFQGRRLSRERTHIQTLSASLAAIRPGAGGPAAPADAISAALEALERLERRLQRKERQSLYNEKQLRQFLARSKEGLAQAR